MTAASREVAASERVHKQYVLDVQITRYVPDGETEPRYRFDAPEHMDIAFDDPEMATLYADIYFAVNGFVEAGTGDRGVPPEVMQAGKDTLAAYLVTQTSINWVASFYGAEPTRIERYISWVREQAEEIRTQVEKSDD